MKREYSNSKIIVYWDSEKCVHAGECHSRLPDVFDLSKRPWVDLEAAGPETIARVIDCCPTGALRYEFPDQDKSGAVTITVMKNGPYKVCGKCRVVSSDGKEIEARDIFALCRCGASKKLPFCDGSHLDEHPHGSLDQNDTTTTD